MCRGRTTPSLDDAAHSALRRSPGWVRLAATLSSRDQIQAPNATTGHRQIEKNEAINDCQFAPIQERRPDFRALLFRRGEPVFIAFDLLFYEDEDIRALPLKERRNILDQVCSRYSIQKSELFVGCCKNLYGTVCSMDLEGVVLKKLSDPYHVDRTTWCGRCRIRHTRRRWTGMSCLRSEWDRGDRGNAYAQVLFQERHG